MYICLSFILLVIGGIFLKIKSLFGILLCTFILSACASSNENVSDDHLLIYTSVYPIQYVVEEITGDEATVQSVYPPGVDAHTYEPTSKEITELANADVFIYLGSGMETFAETTADALKSQDVHFIEIGKQEQLFLKSSHNDEQEHSDFDPHIWLDPLRMIEIGEIIKNELIEVSSENIDTYTENFEIFKERMITLDDQFIDTIESKVNKHIIVSHAAYGYWEDRYDIEQIPISGLSSSDEPSQKELTEIAERAEKEGLQYVIFDQTGSNRLATIIQDHINADKRMIHNIETLTDEDIEQNEDYLSLMEKNLEVLDEVID